MTVNPVIKDYIDMKTPEWRRLYSRVASDMQAFNDTLETVEFEVGYISQDHRRRGATERVRGILDDKELPDEFIDAYMNALGEKDTRRTKPEEIALNIYLNAFTYEGREIRLDELTSRLDRAKFDIVDENSRQAAVSLIERILEDKRFPGIAPGLESIVEYASRGTMQIDDMVFQTDRIIGRSEWRLRDRRQAAYDYWENVDKKYDNMVDALKNFTDKIKDLYEDADHDELNRELEKNFDELKEFYESISTEGSKYNYVKRYYAVKANMASGDIRDVENNALDILNTFFMSLFDADTKHTEEGYKEGETFQEEQYEYETSGGAFDVGEGDKVTVTPQPAMEATGDIDDETARMHEDIKNLKLGIKSLTSVDPLFAWVLSEGGFSHGGFTKASAESMIVAVKNILKGWEVDEDAKRQFKRLHSDMENFLDYAADAEGPYYLPMSIQAINAIGGGSIAWGDSYYEIEESHYQFISAVGELMENPHDRTRTNKLMSGDDWRFGPKPARGGWKREKQTEKDARITIRHFTPSKTGGKRDLKEYAHSFSLLLEAMEEYYVKPSSSKFWPWPGELPTFLQTGFLSSMRMKGKGIEAASEGLWSRYYISMVTATELQTIIEFLNIISNPISDVDSVVSSMNHVLKVLNSITMYKDYKKDSENFFAYHLSKMIDRNDNLELTEQTELNDTPVLTILQRDINMNKQYPIEELINTIWYFREELEHNQYISSQVNELISVIKGWGHFTRSELEVNLLFAHDEIRKMIGKPVYYSLGVPDNFDNVNATIDLMKSTYDIELTANDVIGIVYEFDSMSSIGKKYGTNEEVVYHVKSLYR